MKERNDNTKIQANAKSFHIQWVLFGDVVGVEEVVDTLLGTVVVDAPDVGGLGKVDSEELVELEVEVEGTVEETFFVDGDGVIGVVTSVEVVLLEFVADEVGRPVVTVELLETEGVELEVVDEFDELELEGVVVGVEDDVPVVYGFGFSSTFGLSVLGPLGLSSFFPLFSSSFLLSSDFPCPSGFALSSFGLSSFGLSSGFGLSSLASLAGVSAGLASYFCFGHFSTSAAMVFPSLQLLETNPSQSDTQHSFQILPQTVPLALLQA